VLDFGGCWPSFFLTSLVVVGSNVGQRSFARLFHAPGDLLALHTSARDRRSGAMWLFLMAIVVFVFWPNAVWLVNVLSILALLGIVTGETPVEDEEAKQEVTGGS
jgi:hypothetical protein